MCKTIALMFVLLLTVCIHVTLAMQDDMDLKVRDHMTPAQFQAAGLNKLNASEMAVLDKWFSDVAEKLVQNGASESNKRNVEAVNEFSDLEGATIIAEDGQFLGKITTNSVDSQSIINEVGRYGSEISSTSIHNSISRYGSTVSSQSPFNDITSTPPRIYKNGRFVGYLTTNELKTPRIDPRALIGWLQSQQ